MNVHVIGGGPAGLYFAILMKKAWPQTRITVFERNKPDDTFGFGVVFSDQTLAGVRILRPRNLSPDRRPLRLLGRHRDPLPRHDVPHRRQRLLRHLAHHAAENSRPPRAFARHRHQIRLRGRSVEADDPRRRSRGRRRRHQLAHPRAVQGQVQAEHRAAPQPLRLDGLEAPDGRLQLLLQGDAARHLHRALLSVPARPLDLGDGDRSGDVQARRPRQARRGRRRRTSSKACSPTSSPATSSSPTARCGGISRPSAARNGPPTTSC